MSSATAKKLYLTRRYDFSASHRLYNPTFSDDKNWAVFRQCNNPNGHGHNYELEVTVSGVSQEMTGMVVDIVALDEAVKTRVLDLCDHKNLNLDVPFMADMIPTVENIAVAFWRQLVDHIPLPARLHRIRVVETRNNAAEYFGEGASS